MSRHTFLLDRADEAGQAMAVDGRETSVSNCKWQASVSQYPSWLSCSLDLSLWMSRESAIRPCLRASQR